jgi:hypothetical protein
MATVTGMTAAHTQAILDTTVVDAEIDISGDLIFTRHDGSTFDAGSSLPAIPYASNSETQAGTITNKSVTPASLASTGHRFLLASNSLAESAPITSYPVGVSHMIVGSGSGWSLNGGFGTVITHYLSTTRSIQWFHSNQTAETWVRNYYDTDVPAWEPWVKIVSSVHTGNVSITGALTLTGDVTAAKGRFGGTAGDAVFIGDDAVLADANIANGMVLKGQQTPANGILVLGVNEDARIYRGAANQVKTDNDFFAVGDVYSKGISVPTMDGLAVSGISRSSTSGSTAAGAESALSSTWSGGSNSMVFQDGYVYMFVFWYQISDNINSSYSITIPRLYTSGGANIGGYVHYNGFNGHLGLTYTQVGYIKRVAGTPLTIGVGVTVQRYISGVAGTSFLDNAVVTIHKLGKVADHPAASMATAI